MDKPFASKPIPDTIFDPNFQLAFWHHAAAQPNGCWKWLGSTNAKGYGTIGHGYGTFRAHRIAWALGNGDTESLNGMVVEHTCHNPSCVRPAHLRRSTQKENLERSSHDGRLANKVRYDVRKLNAEQATALRQDYRSGSTYDALVREYGISRRAAFDVIHRKTYKDVA